MDLLNLLRKRTCAHHSRLDAGIDVRSGGITPLRYNAFLRGVLPVVAYTASLRATGALDERCACTP